MSAIEYKECSYKYHSGRSKNLFPKDKVPLERFVDPKNGKIYNMCLECRNYSNSSHKKVKAAREEKREEYVDPNFRFCISVVHHLSGVSVYPREKTPINLFYIKEKYPERGLFETCSDCRKYQRNQSVDAKNLRKQKAEDEGKFLCYQCGVSKTSDEKAIGLNNEEITSCKTCQEKTKIRGERKYKELKSIHEKVKKEIIFQNECSCEICRCIFLKNENVEFNEFGQKYIELPTRNENGINLVDYLGVTYKVKDFLEKFSHLLEVRILEYDHLPENEQIEKGKIKEGQEPFKKNNNVSRLASEIRIREESMGCQLLDCKCHLKETIRREKGDGLMIKNDPEKMEYINNIKKKGCDLCGFSDENFTRFIDMDHIDPKNKTETISNIVTRSWFTLEDVKKECEICRPLCKFCHIFYTIWQRKNTDLYNKVSRDKRNNSS